MAKLKYRIGQAGVEYPQTVATLEIEPYDFGFNTHGLVESRTCVHAILCDAPEYASWPSVEGDLMSIAKAAGLAVGYSLADVACSRIVTVKA